MNEQMPIGSAPDAPQNVLYVILHGLVCLVDDGKDHFIGYLIDMGNDHDYICGDFLDEDDIKGGEYLTLLGADTGSQKLDTKKNAVVKLKQIPTETNYVQSSLYLPRPYDIKHYICGKVDPTKLKDDKMELAEVPPEISGIRVFIYSFKDYRAVRLVNSTGQVFWSCPNPVPVGNLRVAVLHVYNEPPGELDDAAKHNKDEFNFSLAYLGAQLRLMEPAVVEANDPPPPGIAREELYSLDTRPAFASNLISLLRSGKPFHSFHLECGKHHPLGGGGGSQVCGGANGAVGS